MAQMPNLGRQWFDPLLLFLFNGHCLGDFRFQFFSHFVSVSVAEHRLWPPSLLPSTYIIRFQQIFIFHNFLYARALLFGVWGEWLPFVIAVVVVLMLFNLVFRLCNKNTIFQYTSVKMIISRAGLERTIVSGWLRRVFDFGCIEL